MKTKLSGVVQFAAMISDRPNTPITTSSAPQSSIRLRHLGSESIFPLVASTRVGSWSGQPACISSEPWWWSRL